MKRYSEAKSREGVNIWQLQQAKARLSEVVGNAQNEGVQIITKKGEQVAVLMSKKDYDKIVAPKKSLLEMFKESPCQDVELDIERSKEIPRDIDL